MNIQSMTGYAHSSEVHNGAVISVELKSYNNKYFETRFSLPESINTLEEQLRSQLRERCTRGFFDIRIKLKYEDSQNSLGIDLQRARELAQNLRSIQEDLRLSAELSLENILHYEEFLNAVPGIGLGGTEIHEELRQAILRCFSASLDQLLAFRLREGAETRVLVHELLQAVEAAVAEISKREREIEQTIRARLREKFIACLGDLASEERILQEAAALLLRHSIAEELNRLRAHIHQSKKELENGGVVAKRLDFLCQEIHREANTIAAKNIIEEVPRQVIEIKNAVENMREQLRNIE